MTSVRPCSSWKVPWVLKPGASEGGQGDLGTEMQVRCPEQKGTDYCWAAGSGGLLCRLGFGKPDGLPRQGRRRETSGRCKGPTGSGCSPSLFQAFCSLWVH